MNKHTQTGADLISAMQACPYPEIFDEIERFRQRERAFNDHLACLRRMMRKGDQRQSAQVRYPHE